MARFFTTLRFASLRDQTLGNIGDSVPFIDNLLASLVLESASTDLGGMLDN